MKTIHVTSYMVIGLVFLGLTLLLLALPSGDGRFAAVLVAGAIYVTLQIGTHPDRWRTSAGALLPAFGLVALSWFAAGAASAAALLHRL